MPYLQKGIQYFKNERNKSGVIHETQSVLLRKFQAVCKDWFSVQHHSDTSDN